MLIEETPEAFSTIDCFLSEAYLCLRKRSNGGVLSMSTTKGRAARFLISALVLLALSGCSVGMALSGSGNPDLGAIKVGATRGEIEIHLGNPIKSTTLADGRRVDVYRYEIGNEPSAGRAAGHAVLDVLTLGIWEIAGTPIEAVQGEEYDAVITYDQNDKVMEIETRKISSRM